MRRFHSLVFVAAVLAGSSVWAGPATRLYVRTTPPNAKVTLDGKVLGLSGQLYEVSPGRHTVQIERPDYITEAHQVTVPEGQIVRIEVELRRPGEAPVQAPEEKDDRAARAIGAFLDRQDLPADLAAAMQTVLRQHPTETRWSGGCGARLFGLAAKRLPTGAIRERATPAVMELTHSLAVSELLKAKSLLDVYASLGLSDATTLRQAVLRVAGKLNITGSVKGVLHETGRQDDFAVGYVIADRAGASAYLAQPAAVAQVAAAYRDVMHAQARDLMQRGNWQDALLLWKHLHARKLVSQALYLDAARCLKELGENDDAVRLLHQAIDRFGDTATAGFFEQAGDAALGIDTPEAQRLAEQAYREASRRLLDTVSESPSREKEHDR